MKVKQLIAQLSKLDPEFEVVIAKDGEGSGFSPLDETSKALYQPDTAWSGEILSSSDLEDGEKLNSIVLWPTY